MDQLTQPAYGAGIGLGLRNVVERVRNETLLGCIVGVYAAVLFWRLAEHLQQDGWLMLVAGREIAQSGIPTHDSLTYWTTGAQWVDQQWLAQFFFYGLTVAGGVTLALLVYGLITTTTFLTAIAAARAQGGSERATAWAAVLAIMPIVSGSWQMRAQAFGVLFFVLLLWLLVSDGRNPSRRVYLSLALLVLWANVHGSVVVGTLVVLVYVAFGHPAPRKAALLAGGACAALIATPYGLGMVEYYRETLFNSSLRTFVPEWQSPTLQLSTAPVYLLLLGGAWMLASHGARVTRFEKAVFFVAGVLALLAVRNVAFLGFAAAIVLPRTLDEVLPPRTRSRRVEMLVVLTAVTCLAVSGAVAMRSLGSRLEGRFPSSASAAVIRVTNTDPEARVLADVQYADWLLWEHPELRGRIAYDARFELLSAEQLRRIYYWTNQQTQSWKTIAAGNRVIVLSRESTALNEAPLLAEPGARSAYRDSQISVLELPQVRP